jgi:hypothetical protein
MSTDGGRTPRDLTGGSGGRRDDRARRENGFKGVKGVKV